RLEDFGEHQPRGDVEVRDTDRGAVDPVVLLLERLLSGEDAVPERLRALQVHPAGAGHEQRVAALDRGRNEHLAREALREEVAPEAELIAVARRGAAEVDRAILERLGDDLENENVRALEHVRNREP